MKRNDIRHTVAVIIVLLIVIVSISFKPVHPTNSLHISIADTIQYPEETHFKNVQQLTFGGDNAEAYWSYDGKYLVFQRTNPKEGLHCDQIFIGKVPQNQGESFEYKMISTGKGRTTCPFFTKDGKHIIYASTHLVADSCPPVPDRKKYGNKYIWPLYDSYDIFMADTSGNIVKQLTNAKGYDAEATLSPDGKKMIFTSVRNGDLDLYVMDLTTEKVTQITNELGSEIDTSFFSVFCIMGVIDASLKMWGQLDLKKLVAYGTVQEMNLIYIAFLWGDSGSFIGGVLFCITHAFLSSLMFFLVDCIQRRYKTRIISEITGILHTTPNLGISIIFMQIFYSGLPGTLKFLSEFYIFSGFLNSSPLSLILLMYGANFLGLIGFSKCWFNVIFGLTLNKQKNLHIKYINKYRWLYFILKGFNNNYI